MLAEWESRDLHQKAFDMTYAWSLWEKMVTVSKDPSKMHILTEYLAHDVNTFPAAAYRMNFTDNHDKNAWEGNPVKNFGEALPLFMVFAGLVNGMPLVYSGQEAGLGRSLKFFDKDPITWKDHPNAKIYQTLFELKHRNQALWNGNNGGHMNQIINDHPQQVISFYREKNGQQVIGIFNFSNENADLAECLIAKTCKAYNRTRIASLDSGDIKFGFNWEKTEENDLVKGKAYTITPSDADITFNYFDLKPLAHSQSGLVFSATDVLDQKYLGELTFNWEQKADLGTIKENLLQEGKEIKDIKVARQVRVKFESKNPGQAHSTVFVLSK